MAAGGEFRCVDSSSSYFICTRR